MNAAAITDISAANRWCILRTSGPRTLALNASLNEGGIEAWTPTVMVKRRVPRKPGRVEKPAPLFPTFVFAKAAALADLRGFARMLGSPHPAFSIMLRSNGEPALVADREIDKLRVQENRLKPKRRRPTVPIGTEVCPTDGAWAGMTGIVVESDGKATLVAFGGWLNVKIETSILIDGEV